MNKHWTALTLVLAVAMAAAAAAGSVEAQPKPQPDQDQKLTPAQKRKALFNRGETNFRLGEFKKALEDYKAALKIRHHPNLIYNIAQCYRQLKELDKALFFYKLFLADWARLKPNTTPPNHAAVQRFIATLEAEIKAREEQRRRDELHKQQQDLARQRTAMLEAQAREQAEARRRAELAAARNQSQQKQPQQQEGMLNLEGLDLVMARVLVDGREVVQTPISKPIPIKPGKVRLQIVAEGYLPWTKQVAVSPGGAATVRVDLRRPVVKRNGWWLASTLTSLGLAAGAEALAVIFTLRANEHFSDSDAFAGDRSVAIAGHVSAAVLAVWGVTSLVFYLRSGKVEQPASSDDDGSSAAPASASVAPITGGAMVLGRWRF